MSRIAFHYHRPGKDSATFEHQLAIDRADMKVLLAEPYRGETILLHDRPILEHDAPAVWFVFPAAWYDIGRFHLADGTCTGWYTNLCTPIAINGSEWSSSDLFLDLWTPLEGGMEWLDENEYRDAQQADLISLDQARAVEELRSHIETNIARGSWPPVDVREVDLAAVRSILGHS